MRQVDAEDFGIIQGFDVGIICLERFTSECLLEYVVDLVLVLRILEILLVLEIREVDTWA